jgi:hypothetical protein
MSQLFTRTYTNQMTSWLVYNWSTFGARTNHGQTQIHKIHHGLNLGEATTFPLIVFYVPGHEAYTQMSFCLKTPKLGLPQLWRPITSCANLRLKRGLKQSCNLHWEISSSMWNATYTQVNQGDYRLLVMENQNW